MSDEPLSLADELLEASVRGDCPHIGALIRGGANPNALGSGTTWTALHNAIEFGQADAIRLLVALGADIEAMSSPGPDGVSPLAHAIDVEIDRYTRNNTVEGPFPMTRLLLELGANPDTVNDPAMGGSIEAIASHLRSRSLKEVVVDYGIGQSR